ncbi:MAG: hypothetical protein ACI4DK_11250 [Lachnospiraceae bacterium]
MELTKSHKAYFKAAKAVSELSDFKRVNVGAVAVYGHRIISSGCNSLKTNPTQKKYNIYRFEGDVGAHTIHAELQCLLPLMDNKDIDFSRVSLYIYRQHKNGKLALARPCPSCFQMIKDLGIKKIWYSTEDGYACEYIN